LYGLKIWTRALGLKYGSDVKTPLGNIKQMPGIFVIQKGKIMNIFVHKTAADKPDYLAIADCVCGEESL
jgi:hypothetical protein